MTRLLLINSYIGMQYLSRSRMPLSVLFYIIGGVKHNVSIAMEKQKVGTP